MATLINESSIPVLLQEMTIEEKVKLLVGKSFFSTQEFPEYGIPSILYLDGATGVNLMQYLGELSSRQNEETEKSSENEDSNNESGASFMVYIKYVTSHEELPADMPEEIKRKIVILWEKLDAIRPDGEEPGCFPPGILLGATWDPEAVYDIGQAVAREAQAYGVDVLLGTPNTNIHRDPMNGRLFESFSEDPYLSSQLAPEFARAVQDQNMVADVKHFAANNQETLRQGINEIISERALREIYLPGFEAAVKEGQVSTVMSAYNSINGVPCAQNEWLLTKVLKEEWGFDGQVVSDWGAVYDQVAALQAGNDMDMPGPRGKQGLMEAVRDGRISSERLDDAAARTLRMILKTPAFRGKTYRAIDSKLSEKAAYRAAKEGITLLKNDRILPLKENTKLYLAGALSKRFIESGSGSAQVDTNKFTSLVEEVKRYTCHTFFEEKMEDAEVVLITAGASGQEGSDRAGMCFDEKDERMLRENIAEAKKLRKKICLLMNIAGPVDLTAYLDDVDAIVCLFFPGMQGAKVTSDILFGAVNPSGKLPLTFPKRYKDCPTAKNFPGEFGQVMYGEGIYVGYRYYDYKEIEPLYPFGFGLSYTDFTITDAFVEQREYDNVSEESLEVRVTVKNNGKIPGVEVVQLYIRDEKSFLDKPEKELKAFQRVYLMPGEKKIVTLKLTPSSFAAYDTDMQQWTIEPGIYKLLLGNSSRNITAATEIAVTGKNPYGYSRRSSIGKIIKNQEALRVCHDVLGDYFNEEKLRSSATYFGAASLEKFVDGLLRVAGVDEDEQKCYKQQLDKGLEKLPVVE